MSRRAGQILTFARFPRLFFNKIDGPRFARYDDPSHARRDCNFKQIYHTANKNVPCLVTLRSYIMKSGW